MSKERFEILKSSSYYFRLIAPNNEIIGYDTDFNTKEICQQGIADVRSYSQNQNNFTHWQSATDKRWYFNLRKGSKEAVIILRSESYVTEQSCLNGINSVQKFASTAEIIDRTL